MNYNWQKKTGQKHKAEALGITVAGLGRRGGGDGGGKAGDAEGLSEGDLAGVEGSYGPLAAPEVDVRGYAGRPLWTLPAAHLSGPGSEAPGEEGRAREVNWMKKKVKQSYVERYGKELRTSRKGNKKMGCKER